MITLKAKFDKVGLYQSPNSLEEKEASHTHYTIGKPSDPISGGVYLPKKMKFPEEGILIRMEE